MVAVPSAPHAKFTDRLKAPHSINPPKATGLASYPRIRTEVMLLSLVHVLMHLFKQKNNQVRLVLLENQSTWLFYLTMKIGFTHWVI